ncbi:PREDICTED: PH-interacting protein [Tarenaya hassleriana]|uniref:PH-interacting protein n=1 Tax=Tarenaya hassleriana TaxID=28532 RepID=UPI00053C6283|nr:PREDICTED: PH-interacting protein [Tarenaya hassleriana]XP_010544973.1 PREDICTED: PH-interacting protein [Tarenaya hassleriana]XP_010544974.1 PREDICTED: PH-interacting protein [Tarenaya hassleriana]
MEWIHKASLCKATSNLTDVAQDNIPFDQQERLAGHASLNNVDIDLREVYFLILHFLSTGPCKRTLGHLRDELLENQLLPRRYHSRCSRSGTYSGHADDDGISLPLSYGNLEERYPHIEKDHLVKLLKQLILNSSSPLHERVEGNAPNAADVPTLLGCGSFSLLDHDKIMENQQARRVASYLRWPHIQADQVRGLSLREIGGGFTKHHRAPSIRSACYAIARPSMIVQKMQNVKKLRGHRNAVYCAIFDRAGRYVITGSDDRLVKIWSMETAFCLASCRGHEGDITDLAVSSNSALVASASNDFVIRVWRLPDGMPISVLRGHTGAVTAIAFSPRPASVYQLLSSSDDGTCRIWDARYSQCIPRIYIPNRSDAITGKSNSAPTNVASASIASQSHQILCCAYNANGTVFVTGSSDSNARVWSAIKPNADESEQPMHELDVLCGHENDVNYVQFSGCAVAPRSSISDSLKEDSFPKFKNSWFCHDNIVTCSRDGSAIIWTPRSRKSHGKSGRWSKAYHLKVPPPPLPPQPPRGGPRQRFLPTPRGVNMIIWSLDNRFVLAAIMDCRICVWNAADGSLVHCLTGHTESSYVLDVHPFNPRIAMSAGYDGRTIIWDIWEGIPIKIYEIGRFKLVDGKFSQDGTSIVLSDEVGQIYFLNTGQGESQKDAKYDQFFLGDYRPLIRDTNGNVLDQESQLVPHRRNLQDPLCDSSMIPYPEPYQTMYQQRRLGALGLEWRPPVIKFAVGPDFSLGEDYIMPPLADLDRMIEPLPEFIDAMYWEPEIEVLSDDNDSEYNAEEISAGGVRGGLCSSSSDDLECSSEDSDAEHIHSDSNHRKRRTKHLKVEAASSSGRRANKRILEESDGLTSMNKRTKSGRIGLKGSKRKISDVKALRPQRAAAQNARSLLSKISGSSSDEVDEDDLNDSSNSESVPRNLQIRGSESDRSFTAVHQVANSSDMLDPQSNGMPKKKLILKISVKKPARTEENKQDGIISQTAFEQLTFQSSEDNRRVSAIEIYSKEPGSNSVDANGNSQDMPDFMKSCQRENVENQLYESLDLEHNVTRGKEEMLVSESTETAWEESRSNSKRDEDALSVEALSNQLINGPDGTGNAEESNEILPKKVRKLRLKLKRPNSPSADDFTDRGCGSTDVNPSSMNQIIVSEMSHDREASGSEPVISGNMYNVLDSPAPEFEYGEAAVDAIRRKRSMKMKATSSESITRNNILRVRLGSGAMEMVKKQHNSYTRATDRVPLEEWPSSSTRSRSARSSKNSYSTCKKSVIAGSELSNVPRKLSWLMLSEHEEGFRYIPQLGDEVVYFKQGHKEFLVSRDSTDRDHSRLLPRNLGAVEICKVEKLDYDTYPGSGEGCCKLTLRLLGLLPRVSRQEIQLTLPDLIDFPDFIVEKARYDAAIRRNWGTGDRCLVWWRNETGEGGTWWEGRIQSSQAKSDEFPDSPWETYKVNYETGDTNLHSPWEFYDPQCPWENSTIDEEIRDKLLSRFAGLEKSASRHQDNYGIQKLNEAAQKMDFCNRFPVPLYPELIRQRLENRYYRSIDAFKHDVDVMLSNAESYFSRNTQLLSKTRRFRDWFTRTLDKVVDS